MPTGAFLCCRCRATVTAILLTGTHLLSSPFLILTVRDCKPASLPFVDPSPAPVTTDDSKLTPNYHCPVSPRFIPRGYQTSRSFLDYLSTPFRRFANTVGDLKKKVSVLTRQYMRIACKVLDNYARYYLPSEIASSVLS
jgi:hypothetical protein